MVKTRRKARRSSHREHLFNVEGFSIEALKALIEDLTAKLEMRVRELKEAKRLLRNKVGGRASGNVRSSRSEERGSQIRRDHAELFVRGEVGIVAKLASKFGVSESTIQRALRQQPSE